MPNFRCNAVVLCDEIRQEKSDKYLLIGVYPGSVTLQQIPGQLVLSVFFILQWDATGEFDLNIEIDFGENRHRMTMSVIINDTTEAFGIPTPRFPLVAAETGDIVFRLSVGDQQPDEVARFPVRHNPNVWSLFPTEPPQRSAQSQTGDPD